MSTLEEDGITTDRLLELCRRRIVQWERADPHSRAETEAAEAFTRAFAELDVALKDGGRLPLEWMRAKAALLSRDTPPDAGYELIGGKHPYDGESKG